MYMLLGSFRCCGQSEKVIARFFIIFLDFSILTYGYKFKQGTQSFCPTSVLVLFFNSLSVIN